MPLVEFPASPFSVLAIFSSLFKRAFSAFRSALSEAPSTLLICLTTGRCSATGGPFSCSLASFFNLFASFRASFRRLPSLLFPLATKFFAALASLVDRGSSILCSAPGSLANFLSLFASLRSSFEGLLPPSSPLPTGLSGPSSRLLFFDFLVCSFPSIGTALSNASVMAGFLTSLWSSTNFGLNAVDFQDGKCAESALQVFYPSVFGSITG